MKNERMLKELQKFLENNASGTKSEEKLIEQFIDDYNRSLIEEEFTTLNEKTAKTSEDFLELAQEYIMEDENIALKYAKKAADLDKNNIDAKLLLAKITAKSFTDLILKLKEVLKESEKIIEKEGLMVEENIGDFWLILETRPFMRVKMTYADALLEAGLLKLAMLQYEEILRLNNRDNLGARHSLSAIYSIFDEEEKLKTLLNPEFEEAPILLALSILYFKRLDFDKALEYLRKLQKANKDTKKFIKCFYSDEIDEYDYLLDEMRYKAFSIEELAFFVLKNSFVMSSAYTEWAYTILNKRLRK